MDKKAELRGRVIDEIARVEGRIAVAEMLDGAAAKEQLRLAHGTQRDAHLADAADFIFANEHRLIQEFANGDEVDPSQIDPVVIPVRTPGEADLFRYASLQWSVPVSAGYGRRSRFLVRDRQNGKLIAIFALGDPVIAQGARDKVIGWDKENRVKRLYNVYDAFVLGAMDPYRQLLGGKLVALLTLANETREFLIRKYEGNTTVISGEQKDPTPVLITTSSALGRSSVYNRVTFEGRLMFHPVGFTKGYGHFQFSNALFNDMRDFVREEAAADDALAGRDQSAAYGKGPNWRFRVIRTALEMLGIPSTHLQHNIKREVFLAPVASNWDRYLRGEESTIEPFDLPTDAIGSYYRERWAIGRAERKPEFRLWRRDAARLSTNLDVRPRQLALGEDLDIFPGEVDLGAFKLRIGTDCTRTRGESTSGSVQDGIAYMSQLVGENTALTIADITWEDGSRDIRGWRNHDSHESYDQLMSRLRIGIQEAPEYSMMSVMELRMPLLVEGRRATVRKTSVDELSGLLGFDVVGSLQSSFDTVVGTRAELLGDEGRRRNELCAVFPTDSRSIPPLLWALSRALPVGAQLTNPMPRASSPRTTRRAPDLLPSTGE